MKAEIQKEYRCFCVYVHLKSSSAFPNEDPHNHINSGACFLTPFSAIYPRKNIKTKQISYDKKNFGCQPW